MNTPRLLFGIATMCCVLPFDYRACGSTNVVGQFDRTIIKQPTYQSTPKYSLMALGNSGDVKVWMVEDGKRLFVDKNANGDLTDDGPPIEPSKVRDLGGNRWDFEYVLDAITPTNGSRHTSFVLRRWNYNDPEDSYGLSLSVGGQMPMYAGWFGTFWSTNRDTAPVIHFGGPFTPMLLRRKESTLGETQQRLSLCFVNPGSGSGAVSRLSIDALPRLVTPELDIEWRTAGGGAPLRTSHELKERCCYWEFYTTEFEPPRGIVPGNAKVSIRFAAGAMPVELTTTEIEEPVVAQPQGAEVSGAELGGIGVVLRVEGTNIVVNSIIPDSPAAAQKNIHAGDQILGVAQDKEPAVQVQSGKLAQAVALIRGPNGTTVRLTIVPAGAGVSRAQVVSFVRGELKQLWGDGVALPNGSKAPDIEMVALAGGAPERLSDYAGKIVILEFWATWCGPCQIKMAELQGYAGKHPDWKDKVILIAASVDDNQEAAIKHLKAKGWDQTHNVWVGAGALKAYHLEGIPAAYVINRQGRIVAANPEDLPGFVNLEVRTKQGSEDKRQ